MLKRHGVTTATVLCLLFTSFLTNACEPALETGTGMGTLELRLHDMPIDSADEVNVFIERVEVNNASDTTGWSVISEPARSFDLLELTNGAYEVLGTAELEAGRYPQIRLVLAESGHDVVIDGESYAMNVPSGANTGVKVNVNAMIEPDIEYVLMLDFDASRSVVQTGVAGAGHGNEHSSATAKPRYQLKPVVSATNQAMTGNIEGTVEPAEAEPVVYAVAGSDTVSSTVADTTSGEFKLIGLEEGSYTVSIDPRNDGFQSQNISGVQVTAGNTADLEMVEVSR